MSPNMIETFDWLRKAGFMKSPFTIDERTEISRAFSSGNYANAYEGTDLESALEAFNAENDDDDALINFNRKDHERAAFVLGFFGSYTLDEIGSDEREIFDECYFSAAGWYVVNHARYTDSRHEEYLDEHIEAFGEDEIEDDTPSLPQPQNSKGVL